MQNRLNQIVSMNRNAFLGLLMGMIFFIPTHFLVAQGYNAYHNFSNDFVVFQNGRKKKVEYTAVLLSRIGGNSVGYVTNMGLFKIYSDGAVIDTRLSNPSRIINTDYFLTVQVGQQIKAFDKGRLRTVTNWATTYKVGDSIIVYFDEVKNDFNAYYNSKNYTLEENVAGSGNFLFRVGDNIMGYVDNNFDFKAFYQGKTYRLSEAFGVERFGIGKNIIAYFDNNTGVFNTFYRGKVDMLEAIEPDNYFVGDDMVAYNSNNGVFKVFYQGQIMALGAFEPEDVFIKDNILTYNQDGAYKLFYKGKVYSLGQFIPTNFKADFNTFVYINEYNQLEGFVEGEKKVITREVILDYSVNQSTISYRTLNGSTKIYYKGETY